MKRLLIITLIALVIVACSKQSQTSAPTASKETTYPMTATIVSRDPAKNTVNLDNVEVPGKMAAMKMDYELRGAKVAELPHMWIWTIVGVLLMVLLVVVIVKLLRK
jgi:PBP1b-binding outer membrane lipoprotein LpoB